MGAVQTQERRKNKAQTGVQVVVHIAAAGAEPRAAYLHGEGALQDTVCEINIQVVDSLDRHQQNVCERRGNGGQDPGRVSVRRVCRGGPAAVAGQPSPSCSAVCATERVPCFVGRHADAVGARVRELYATLHPVLKPGAHSDPASRSLAVAFSEHVPFIVRGGGMRLDQLAGFAIVDKIDHVFVARVRVRFTWDGREATMQCDARMRLEGNLGGVQAPQQRHHVLFVPRHVQAVGDPPQLPFRPRTLGGPRLAWVRRHCEVAVRVDDRLGQVPNR